MLADRASQIRKKWCDDDQLYILNNDFNVVGLGKRENKQNLFLFYMIWKDCCLLPFRQSGREILISGK